MIRHVAQMAHETCENVRGGHGVFEKEHLITAEELRGFGKMAARITLQKGAVDWAPLAYGGRRDVYHPLRLRISR